MGLLGLELYRCELCRFKLIRIRMRDKSNFVVLIAATIVKRTPRVYMREHKAHNFKKSTLSWQYSCSMYRYLCSSACLYPNVAL